MNSANTRAKREISHGKWLAEQETEVVWGWGTPAGRVRAQRRANLILAGQPSTPAAVFWKLAVAPVSLPRNSRQPDPAFLQSIYHPS
jgi:hypothetical protein